MSAGTCHYRNDALELELNGRHYLVDVDAEAEWYYSPGSMYCRNGDPGDAPDGDFEVTSVDAIWYDLDAEGDEYPIIEPTERMEEYLRDILQDRSDDWDYPDDW